MKEISRRNPSSLLKLGKRNFHTLKLQDVTLGNRFLPKKFWSVLNFMINPWLLTEGDAELGQCDNYVPTHLLLNKWQVKSLIIKLSKKVDKGLFTYQDSKICSMETRSLLGHKRAVWLRKLKKF